MQILVRYPHGQVLHERHFVPNLLCKNLKKNKKNKRRGDNKLEQEKNRRMYDYSIRFDGYLQSRIRV